MVRLSPEVVATVRPVPRYEVDFASPQAILTTRYAEATLLNPEDWDSTRRDRIPTAIELIYSQYPADTSQWITPYGDLMQRRVANLLALDRRLADPRINWSLVPQTDVRTEAEAKQVLHGFVVHYRIDLGAAGDNIEALQEHQYDRVQRLISGELPFGDSIVFRVLTRHPSWRQLTVVMDWTGSMYPYGAAIVHHHLRNPSEQRLLHLIIFNDGDDFLPEHEFRRHKVLGRTGGIYEADPEDVDDIMSTLSVAMKRGDGAEPPENNVEALLFAQRRNPAAERLTLIADNHSPVRDLVLTRHLRRPVDIILCGTRQFPTHPDYVTLAWRTGGSLQLHAGEYRFEQAQGPVPPRGFQIGRQRFRLVGDRFVSEDPDTPTE